MSDRSPNRCLVTGAVALALAVLAVAPPAATAAKKPTSITVDLPVSTQGPLWPPAEVTNAAGDFVLIGVGLVTAVPGQPGVLPVFGAAWLVSKDTPFPVDASGRRIIENWFISGHKVIRPLDLSRGSPDLDMELFSLSMGPPDDDTGTLRIPAQGDSAQNLNTDQPPCSEVFPTTEQLASYSRPRYPLNQVPIYGFQGDGVDYDIITGQPFKTNQGFGHGCGTGCPGEDLLDRRPPLGPITLGQWIEARGQAAITLTDYDPNTKHFTAADFEITLRHMIPNSIYTVWTFRPRRIPGDNFIGQANPLTIPNVIVTDRHGFGVGHMHVINPFPDPAIDTKGLRITGLIIAWHPDYQNWGACGGRLGAGVDIFSHLNTVVNGNLDFTTFVTTGAPYN
jgi:hypothetical protein